MKNKLLLMTVVFITLITSCAKENSEDVNQDKIYTGYELFYNKNTDKTIVIARFKFGGATGTNLELSDGAYVVFNTDTLYYNDWYVGHMKEYAGKLTSGTFKYVDVNGDSYVNSVPTYDTIAFQPEFDTIIKSQANTLTWVGNSLAAQESVGVFIGSWTWGQDALLYQDLDGATDIVMGITQLSNLALGTSTVYMDRTKHGTLNQGTSEGGFVKSTYRALNTTVQVVQ